jgi:hypothetical protein
VVKTLGIRNAKPTADREIVDEYIKQQRTPPIENEAGMVWMPEREGRDGDAEEAASQCKS